MTPEKLVDEIDFIARTYDSFEYGLPVFNLDKVVKYVDLIKQFSKQCFEAGIKLGYQNGVSCTCFEEDDKLEYSNFEDYLETLNK